MEWIVSLITTVCLVGFLIWFLTRKHKPREMPAVILLTVAFLIYHIGDWGLWGGCQYEFIRRVASVGFCLMIPMILLLMYMITSKDHMNLFYRIITLILTLPWIAGIIMVYKYPIVYLETYPGTGTPLAMWIALISFIVGMIFVIIMGYRASRLRTDPMGKSLGCNFATGSLIFTVIIIFLWYSPEILGKDYTWFFGVATIIFMLFICIGMGVKKEKEES